ncbi:MAG: tRNA (N6-isopentenyl adenosine(37)-C2)-methylthiotransferase MiaB, partial [Bdellovibrionales bacterium]|nr:tRNA (N6-isopentenyl adenosine(37)-C2)-methylthiotransferase MiaB [Bdellovibrionales bacterium]
QQLVQIGELSEEAADVQDRIKQRVYIKTFGCQMNEYDTAKLYKILEREYLPVGSPELADLVLINTCSVRDKPEQKLYSLIGEMRPLKRKNPQMLVGVGGCVAQQEGHKIVSRSKEVDFVFGTHNLSLVPALIAQRKNGAPPPVAVDYRDEWEELPLGYGELNSQSRVTAFVSISRGCNKNCTYCIVPTTRGPEVSRGIEEILREVRIAAQRGAREIVLLGQTVNSYGLDLNPRLKFTELLERISQVDAIKRIRFTSPHPQEVRNDFFEILRSNQKICRHIHMPLQSGSDRILKLMNRNYRRKRYLDIIAGLKDADPEVAVTTDIIVGFPGETRADFEETLEVMKEVEFDNSYSFVFSPRPGTSAAQMPDRQQASEKLDWLKELQSLQLEITARRLRAWVGKTVEVLVEGPSKASPDSLQGRTSQNITVNLRRTQELVEPGRILPVSIESAARFTLKGSLVTPIEEPGLVDSVESEGVQELVAVN